MIKKYTIMYLILALVIIPSAHLHSDNDKPVTAKKEQKKTSLWTKLAIAGAAIGTAAAAVFTAYTLYPKTTTLTPDQRTKFNIQLDKTIKRYVELLDQFESEEFRTIPDKQEGIMLTDEELIQLSNMADERAINFLKKQSAYEKYRDKVLECNTRDAKSLIQCIDIVVTPFAPDLALYMKQDVYNQWLTFYDEIQNRRISEIREKYLNVRAGQ
jgi:hypothetical protein